jgi:hypothetical protein
MTIEITEALPDHTEELNLISNKINSLHEELNEIKASNKGILKVKSNKIFILLFRVGELGMTRDPYKKPIEDYYTTKFKKTPSMGEKLYQKQIDDMYRPYDRLKKKIWKIIEKFDLKYQEDLI